MQLRRMVLLKREHILWKMGVSWFVETSTLDSSHYALSHRLASSSRHHRRRPRWSCSRCVSVTSRPCRYHLWEIWFCRWSWRVAQCGVEQISFLGRMGSRYKGSQAGKYRRILQGTNWLLISRQVVLKQLIMHNWSDGEVQSKYLLGNYKSKFGVVCLDSGVKGWLILTVDRITTTSIVLTFTKNSSQLLRRLERAQSANWKWTSKRPMSTRRMVLSDLRMALKLRPILLWALMVSG